MKILAFLLLLLFCLLPVNTIEEEEISFYSDAPSQNLEMKGTLELPNAGQKLPGIVLIHGSGQGQRNESAPISFPNMMRFPAVSPTCGMTTPVMANTFADVSKYLADSIAVLRYDKRSCTVEGKCAGSSYHLCPLDKPSPDCIDLHKLTTNDFVIDAVSAMSYLASRDEIDTSQLYFIGHSQGCTIAPIAAEMFRQKTGISAKGVGLLMGVGIPIDVVLTRQIEDNIQMAESMVVSCSHTPGSEAWQLLNAFKNALEQNKALLKNIELGFEQIFHNDTIKDTDMVNFGLGLTSVGFWRTWHNQSLVASHFEALQQLVAEKTEILSINSSEDQTIVKQFYEPLHAMLNTISNSTTSIAVKVIRNLTHWLTPADGSTGAVDQCVLETLGSWISH